MVSWVSVKENLITVGFFTGILFPLRMLFYSYLSSYWIGSFGVITVVNLSLLYLAKKERLGEFGNIIIRRFYKRAKGKSGIGAIAFSIFFIYFSSMIIIGCTYTAPQNITLVKQGLAAQGVHNLDDAFTRPVPKMSWYDYIEAAIVLLIPSQIQFAVWKVANQMSDGWLLSFSTVDMTEAIEVLGLMFYLRYTKVLEIGK